MQTGVFLGSQGTLGELGDQMEAAAARSGVTSLWLPQIFGFDALTAIAALADRAPGVEIGTSVIPTYPRHPMMLAAQALTAQAATDNRILLGIGLSHQVVIENMFGYSFEKPARHMREYLSALLPLLAGEPAGVKGETLTAMGQLTIPGASRPPVLLAALAPTMLKLAGGVADGTITWMTGPATVESHIVPSINAAASDAGRADPRVVVALPVMVTNDPDAARARAAKVFAVYGGLPSYRAMLDKEGAAGPADVVIVGDESTVAKEVARMADAGATDFVAAPFGDDEQNARTLDVVTG
ncbi:MAG TPA: TIGR03564 family F420-dependent LLM class oxidoreductase [Acidimicrobiales bacterium]|nr:TIGR03564 family F420-dependent LLM class oxidoreductase [Acidimicrobiales bacterium]